MKASDAIVLQNLSLFIQRDSILPRGQNHMKTYECHHSEAGNPEIQGNFAYRFQ